MSFWFASSFKMAFWIQILAKQSSDPDYFSSKFKLNAISKNFSVQNGF
jgi:hypothetical protein